MEKIVVPPHFVWGYCYSLETVQEERNLMLFPAKMEWPLGDNAATWKS